MASVGEPFKAIDFVREPFKDTDSVLEPWLVRLAGGWGQVHAVGTVLQRLQPMLGQGLAA